MANATQDEVNQLYLGLLGRGSDPASAGWTNYGVEGARAGIMNSPEYTTNFINKQKADQSAVLDRQKQEQEGLFSNYENIRKNQEALPTLYNRLQNEAGIPQLNQQAQTFKNEIYKVKDTLDHLGEDVLARTTGYNVSDAQRRRLETAEAEPLQTNLGRLGTGLAPVADMLSSAQNSVNTRLGLEEQQQERALEPVKLRINAASDRFAREITGYTSDRELQLSTFLDQIKRQNTLSDREWELAQQLAAEEREYSRQKSLAASQLSLYSTAPASSTPATPVSSASSSPAYSDWLSIGGGPNLNLGSNSGLSVIGGGGSGGLSFLSNGGSYSPAPSGTIPIFSNSKSGDPLGVLSRLK